MKKLNILLLIVASLFTLTVTGQGIKFEKGTDWPTILAKAQAENKYIFMDCYATWCGPCRFMSENIFTKKEIGDFMNENFINVAVQMDQTPNDSADIKKWYADSKLINKQYNIDELPTYILFSPSGQAVHRIIGSTGSDPQIFLTKVREAFNSGKVYDSLLLRYKNHLNDSIYLKACLDTAIISGDLPNAEIICNAYLSCIRNPYRKNILQSIEIATLNSQDKGFDLFLNNITKINGILARNPAEAEEKVGNIISEEKIIPLFSKNEPTINWNEILYGLKRKYPTINQYIINRLYTDFESLIQKKELQVPLYHDRILNVDWKVIALKIKNRYPGYDPEKMIAKEKISYYGFRKQWGECENAVLAYMHAYGNQLNSWELNSIAWNYAFMHFTNHKTLKEALNWSYRSISKSPNINYSIDPNALNNIDTYANLLYKSGDKNKAILWEKKVIDLAFKFNVDFQNQEEFKINMKRMQKGEKTWVGRDERRGYAYIDNAK